MKYRPDKPPINWARLLGGICLTIISVVAAFGLQPLVSGKTDAINTVVTVFSILAGFLIAVITFIGEPSSASWRNLQLSRGEVKARLDRHLILFYLYLATLGLAMAMFLIPPEYIETKIWLERGFIFFAVFVFGASFTLPHSLRALQMAKYDEAIEEDMPHMLKMGSEKK